MEEKRPLDLTAGISFLSPEADHSNELCSAKYSEIVDELLSQTYKSRKYIRADGSRCQDVCERLAEGRTVHNVETGILLADDEVIWTNVSAAPVDVADVGVVVVTVDITDRKRAERALQDSHQRLRILSQRLVEVQEDERRAACELHDVSPDAGCAEHQSDHHHSELSGLRLLSSSARG
jgi:PAS domain-containing protein